MLALGRYFSTRPYTYEFHSLVAVDTTRAYEQTFCVPIEL